MRGQTLPPMQKRSNGFISPQMSQIFTSERHVATQKKQDCHTIEIENSVEIALSRNYMGATHAKLKRIGPPFGISLFFLCREAGHFPTKHGFDKKTDTVHSWNCMKLLGLSSVQTVCCLTWSFLDLQVEHNSSTFSCCKDGCCFQQR